MLENLHFTYDGKSSKDFGVQLVHPSGGLYKEQFLPNRKIVETSVAGRSNPFFHRVDSDPSSFSLHIYLPEWEERNNLRQISRWLYQDNYKPLIFESNPDIIYYAMVEGKSELTHNGLFQGYISLTVRLNSPYCYSTVKEEKLIVNPNAETRIYNNGDLPMHISFEATKTIRNGDVSIVSDTIEGAVRVYDMVVNETVYVDADNEIVTSSMEEQGRYLALNHNDVWITIEPETEAWIGFTGFFDITLKYQYAYLNVDNELIGKAGGNC